MTIIVNIILITVLFVLNVFLPHFESKFPVSVLIYVLIITTDIYFFFKDRRISAKYKIQTELIGNDITTKLPFSIIVLNQKDKILWANEVARNNFDFKNVKNNAINSVIPGLTTTKKSEFIHRHNDRFYDVIVINNVYYLFDVTKRENTYRENTLRKYVIAQVEIDSISELYDISTNERLKLVLAASEVIENYAKDYNFISHEYDDSGKFIWVLSKDIYNRILQEQFTILNDIQRIRLPNNQSLSASIGVSLQTTNQSLPKLVKQSIEALKIAKLRGGMQAVIFEDKKVSYVGGKNVPFEKKSRLKVRLLADRLESEILKHDQDVIMGHNYTDMDSFASSLAIANIVNSFDRKAMIVIDDKDMSRDVKQTYLTIRKTNQYKFINSRQDLRETDKNDTLLVILDCNSATMVQNAKILSSIDDVIVIDHHVRADVDIKNAIASYVEVTASSTSEIITELITYLDKKDEIVDVNLANLLLSGILLDTKNFNQKTGQRTFYAASILKGYQASMQKAKDLRAVSLDYEKTYLAMLENVTKLQKDIAILTTPKVLSRDVIADYSDRILLLKDVCAAFVIAKIDNNHIAISARSNEKYNLQIVMEKLGGGGHFSIAAAVIKSNDIEDVKKQLIQVIKNK